MLNQTRLNIAEDVAQEIEDYLDATEEFSRDEEGQAGFFAPAEEPLRDKRREENNVAQGTRAW